jgi:hypothetical protein
MPTVVRDVLGLSVAWQSSDGSLVAEIEALTRLLPSPAQDPTLSFSLEPQGDQVELRQDGAHATPVAHDHAFSVTMQWLLAVLIERSDLLPIHGGMVARDGRALLLPAMSGRGKSTLTTAMLGVGFRFGSDELCPLGDDGQVRAYPMPIRIREDALARLGSLPPQVARWPTRIYRKDAWSHFLLPDPTIACEQPSYRPTLIVFPSGFHEHPEPALRRISPGDAAMRLMAERLGPAPTSRAALDRCTDLCLRTPSYDVVSGDPRRTARTLADLFDES